MFPFKRMRRSCNELPALYSEQNCETCDEGFDLWRPVSYRAPPMGVRQPIVILVQPQSNSNVPVQEIPISQCPFTQTSQQPVTSAVQSVCPCDNPQQPSVICVQPTPTTSPTAASPAPPCAQPSSTSTCPQPACPQPVCPQASCPSCPTCPSCSANCPQPVCVTCPPPTSTTTPTSSSTTTTTPSTVPWIGDPNPTVPASTPSTTPAPAPAPSTTSTSCPPLPYTIQKNSNLVQFTPTIRNANIAGSAGLQEITDLSYKSGLLTDQSPTGNTIPDLSRTAWDKLCWDGTVYNPCDKTRSQVCEYLFPGGVTMRGLEQLYNALQPFADPKNPTAAELDEWHLQVVRLLRNLIGKTTPVDNVECFYKRAQWYSEKKYSTYWDSKYPNHASCGPTPGGHCGFTFEPDCTEQNAVYGSCCQPAPAVEGVGSVDKNLPWSVKLSNVIKNMICADGLTNHGGPWTNSRQMGLSFIIIPGTEKIEFRGVWHSSDPAEYTCGGAVLPP